MGCYVLAHALYYAEIECIDVQCYGRDVSSFQHWAILEHLHV